MTTPAPGFEDTTADSLIKCIKQGCGHGPAPCSCIGRWTDAAVQSAFLAGARQGVERMKPYVQHGVQCAMFCVFPRHHPKLKAIGCVWHAQHECDCGLDTALTGSADGT